MSECEKMNCGYYYKDEHDGFPCCHFEGYWMVPCVYEDDYEEEEQMKGEKK